MPPCGIHGIACAPTSDVPSVSLARVIFVFKDGTELRLGVKRGKGADIALPTEDSFSQSVYAAMSRIRDTYVWASTMSKVY